MNVYANDIIYDIKYDIIYDIICDIIYDIVILHIGWFSTPKWVTLSLLPKELFHQDGTGVDGEVGEVLSGGVAGDVKLQHLQAMKLVTTSELYGDLELSWWFRVFSWISRWDFQ